MTPSYEAQISKQGNALELRLLSGKLFFNVTKPLASDESMEIQTSTMVTGIRGTSGYVCIIDEWTTLLVILDGKVSVSSFDGAAVLGDGEQEQVNAGEVATLMRTENGCNMEIRKIELEDIPGFVAQEIQKSHELQQRILEDTGLSVEEIVASADERLAADEEEARKAFEPTPTTRRTKRPSRTNNEVE